MGKFELCCKRFTGPQNSINFVAIMEKIAVTDALLPEHVCMLSSI